MGNKVVSFLLTSLIFTYHHHPGQPAAVVRETVAQSKGVLMAIYVFGS